MTIPVPSTARFVLFVVCVMCLIVSPYLLCGCAEQIDSVQVLTDAHCRVMRVTLARGKLVQGTLDAACLDAIACPRRVEIVTQDGRRVVYQGRTLPQAEVLSGGR